MAGIKTLSKIESKISKKAGKIEKKIQKELSKKILTKPKAKGPAPISSRKALRSFTNNRQQVVREVEKKEIVRDDRSLFFKKEFEKEKMGVNKWLS